MYTNRLERFGNLPTLVMLVIAAALLVLAAGCSRGRPSDKPPIHLNPNMDDQPKYKAQAESKFFANHATMRTPVEGTVARGELRENAAYYQGVDSKGNPIEHMPVEVTMPLLLRGQERFNIYCSPCHSRVGDGKGIMIQRGYVPPPSFYQQYLIDSPDGHFFSVITNGIRNMPSYSHQIPVEDRWAIVAYLRALQRSHNATLEDIPQEKRGSVN